MENWLFGKFILEIVGIHNRRYDSDRYLAKVIDAPKKDNMKGKYVNIRFKNHGFEPETFFGRTGEFDGVDNDIRKNPSFPHKDRIGKRKRPGSTYQNPFI